MTLVLGPFRLIAHVRPISCWVARQGSLGIAERTVTAPSADTVELVIRCLTGVRRPGSVRDKASHCRGGLPSAVAEERHVRHDGGERILRAQGFCGSCTATKLAVPQDALRDGRCLQQRTRHMDVAGHDVVVTNRG